VVLKNDEFAIKVAMKILGKDSDNIKMVRIKNTLKITEMEISAKLLEEAYINKKLSILGEPIRLKADIKGNLTEYPYID